MIVRINKVARPRARYVGTTFRDPFPFYQVIPKCKLVATKWYLGKDYVKVNRQQLDWLLVILNARQVKIWGISGTRKGLAKFRRT